MDIDRADLRMSDQVRDRAEVIDVGVGHDDGVDAATSRDDPRQQCAPSDASVAARACVEERQRIV